LPLVALPVVKISANASADTASVSAFAMFKLAVFLHHIFTSDSIASQHMHTGDLLSPI